VPAPTAFAVPGPAVIGAARAQVRPLDRQAGVVCKELQLMAPAVVNLSPVLQVMLAGAVLAAIALGWL